jgi:hypothetical protein
MLDREISFKLIFDDPSRVSRGWTNDIAEVNFRNADFFVRKSDMTVLAEKSRILVQRIPVLLEVPSASLELIQATATSAASA